MRRFFYTPLVVLLLSFAPPGATAGAAVKPLDLSASGASWNILAPGQHGSIISDQWSVDQAKMYDALTPLRGNVSMAQLQSGSYYKPETMDTNPPVGIVKRQGLAGHTKITWWLDAHKVPHIWCTVRSDCAFALGYFAASDRNLLIDSGRGPGYVSALSVPGVNAFGLITSATAFTPSSQTLAWMDKQVNEFKKSNPQNLQVYNDFVDYVAGLNAWYKGPGGKGNSWTPWTVRDAFASFSFIGSIFGNGGGNEVANSNFLAKLQTAYGQTEGLKIFRDFRHSNDLDAPISWKDSVFPYNNQPSNITNAQVPGSAVVDVNSETAEVAVAARAAATATAKRYMSNALLVPSSRSLTGSPLAVMGPQLGYYYPEIVMEADVHGGGFDFRGAIAPVAPYGLIGRGRDYAWSLTSASSDNTDQFLEKLCVPGGGTPTRQTHFYEYNGRCTAFSVFDAGLLGASGNYGAAHELRFYESVHGPISGTVLVGGKPYAVANARANRGREPWSARALADLSTGQVKDPATFFHVANEFDTTFNWHYLDYQNICFFSSGRLPVRAGGVDSSLPTLGTGSYNWKGFLTEAQHPHGCNPKAVKGDLASDLILNWNNHPAAGWGSADDEWSYASSHRMDLFQHLFRLRSAGKTLKLNDVVGVMNQAATQDTSAVDGWPAIKRLLTQGVGGANDLAKLQSAAPDSDTAHLVGAIESWATEQRYSRLDTDLDGKFDHRGVVAWGEAWPRVADAVVRGRLNQPLADSLWSVASRGDKTYQGMGVGMVKKDLGQLLGDKWKSPTHQVYCGAGVVAACKAQLWAALQAAAAQTVVDTASSDPTDWLSRSGDNPLSQRVRFGPLYPKDPSNNQEMTMRWTNRPTFQQAISFADHR